MTVSRYSASNPQRVRNPIVPTLAVVFAFHCAAVHAQSENESGRTFFAEVEAGAEYDSVVSLDELDLSNDVGDQALILEASLGLEQTLAPDTELDLRYSYSVLDYQDVSEVDQSSHILSGDLKTAVGDADVGLAGFYVNSDLNNDPFLELARVSPYVSGFFTKGWFARAAYVYTDKSNDVNPGRDATASIGEIDIYHFPAGQRWFFNVGYKYRDEDASAARFDYSGNTYKLRFVQRLTLWERDARFELGFRRLDRDYSSVTPSIGEERFDRRDRTQAQLELELSERLDLELYYNYSDWESNLPSVDFHQHVAGFRFRYRWEH